MALMGQPAQPLKEDEIEHIEARVRRIFLAACCLAAITFLALLVAMPRWAELPRGFRYGLPALLLWCLVVTAYSFHAQVSLSEQMRETLRRKTFLDEVTGVFNYRFMDIRLAEEAERTRRYGGFTAILYIDLDGFKRVNDKFGHQVGNLVLGQLAQTMARNARSCDVFGRIGGDEFLVILPQTDRREAYVLAERLRECVEKYTLEIEGQHLVDFVRCSIGVAAYPVNGETMDNVITAADNAVYQAKEQGGNKVCMAEEFISTDSVGKRIMQSMRGPQRTASQ